MECEKKNYCLNYNSKCFLCFAENQFVSTLKTKQPKCLKTKNTKRQGSVSEVKNQQQNNAILSAASSGTPNSGAGKIKGDEQIKGIINIMEEIKTTVKKNINKDPGKETFTIKKEWLAKLKKEAKEANMEFDYLKFSFKENDDDFYVVVDQSVIMDMVATMVSDRVAKQRLEIELELYKKKYVSIVAENAAIKAKIEDVRNMKEYKESIKNLESKFKI